MLYAFGFERVGVVDRTHCHSLADLDGLLASAGFPAGELGIPRRGRTRI